MIQTRKFSTVSLSGGHRPAALPLTLVVEGVLEPGEGLHFFRRERQPRSPREIGFVNK
jgi:hypothetical protein